MKQIDRDKNIITYSDDKLSHIKVIYGEYSETSDITFIMKDIVEKATEKCISTEVVGFYYGEPEIEYIEQYTGNLKANF